MKKYFWFFFLSTLINPIVFGQDVQEKLKVGFAGSEPFVFHGEKEDGIVIDIWKEIAFGLNKSYELIEFQSVESGIKAIDKKELDILIGPITINSSRAAWSIFLNPITILNSLFWLQL